MPPRHATITEVTNPQVELRDASALERRNTLGSKLGALVSRGERISPPTITDLDMNVAESYGIQWDAEKCGRDALQNFFDANGGSLDGVRVYTDEAESSGGDGESPFYSVRIDGDGDYDFRDLTVIGATTKGTGGHTAGGFGEGAKFLALSLLRDHQADRVIYRSRDWQLEFFIRDLPSEKVARPTRGLFARVATGLEPVKSSSMVVTSRNEDTVQSIYGARQFFRSSENPDFQGNILEKTLPDGTQTGVKFLGVDTSGYSPGLNDGHLYVAGQRRHYSRNGRPAESWDTVEGLSVWTTKDVAPGDRDRGEIGSGTLKDEVFTPLVQTLGDEDVKAFFQEIEEAYGRRLSGGFSELATLGEMIATKGEALGVTIDFDPKYVAVNPFLSSLLRDFIEKAGYTLCPDYYKRIGMKTDTEVLRSLHEHQRVEPSPEQQVRIDILQEGLSALTEVGRLKKEITPKEIWLYSKRLESNPFEGTYDEKFVWLSEEHLEGEFATVLATYLHETDHKYGTDASAEFSYALTETLVEVLHAVTTSPELGKRFQMLAQRWSEAATSSPAES